ncbi:MAG: class I SAM-dependent DNA methyltransferase [Halanaerobiales bacterium]
MSGFDNKAENWDEKPERLERARRVAEGIQDKIKVNPDMKAFEYGCGTGLLSFQLHKYFKKIVLADNSRGMLDVLKDKIEKHDVENMEVRYLDLTSDPTPSEKFDIIYTLMTLHHIPEVDKVITDFSNMLGGSGYLCIADLVEEDGSFHGDQFQGHNGFTREELEGLLVKHGFETVDYSIIYERKKMIDDREMIFPVFLLIAQKSIDS